MRLKHATKMQNLSVKIIEICDLLEGADNIKSLYLLFNLVENILNYPYEDSYRILNLKSLKNKIFHLSLTKQLLDHLGFEYGFNIDFFVLPYDKDLLIIYEARETLCNYLTGKLN